MQTKMSYAGGCENICARAQRNPFAARQLISGALSERVCLYAC